MLSRLVVFDSCDPVDCSPPDSSVYEILQARILEWVATSFSRGSSRPRNRTQVSALQADSLPTELQIVAVTILNAGSLQLKTDGSSDFKEFIFSRKGQINK